MLNETHCLSMYLSIPFAPPPPNFFLAPRPAPPQDLAPAMALVHRWKSKDRRTMDMGHAEASSTENITCIKRDQGDKFENLAGISTFIIPQ